MVGFKYAPTHPDRSLVNSRCCPETLVEVPTSLKVKQVRDSQCLTAARIMDMSADARTWNQTTTHHYNAGHVSLLFIIVHNCLQSYKMCKWVSNEHLCMVTKKNNNDLCLVTLSKAFTSNQSILFIKYLFCT